MGVTIYIKGAMQKVTLITSEMEYGCHHDHYIYTLKGTHAEIHQIRYNHPIYRVRLKGISA